VVTIPRPRDGRDAAHEVADRSARPEAAREPGPHPDPDPAAEPAPEHDDAPGPHPDPDPDTADPEGGVEEKVSADMMRLLGEHVPLTLLADLAERDGPPSPVILENEGLPEVAWWEQDSR
jgi:hypothetical protein